MRPTAATWCLARRICREPSTWRRRRWTIQGGATNGVAGHAVSGAGDVDGDGIDDLLIGAPFASPNGRFFAGASYVVLGTDQGFPATIDLTSEADLIIQGAAEGDLSGNSVSGVGDVNGDGIDDLIVGAPNADPEDRTYAGASFVVLGASDLAGTIDLADPVNGADLIIQGAATYDFSGSSVSGGATSTATASTIRSWALLLPIRTTVRMPAPATWCSVQRTCPAPSIWPIR